jgi:nucleoside 2-deoxyribosyltransferase
MDVKNRTHGIDWDDVLIYLCGPMDYVDDGGVGWREEIIDKLIAIGFKRSQILNPCQKPISSAGHKLSDEQAMFNKYREMEDWEGLERLVKKIMNIDLRMVDKSDIIISNLSFDVKMTGTIHEIVQARQQHKPVYVIDTQGMDHVSGWMLALVGRDRIHFSQDSVVESIRRIKKFGPQSMKDAKDFLIFDFDQQEEKTDGS